MVFIFDYKCEGEQVGRYELFKDLIVTSSLDLLNSGVVQLDGWLHFLMLRKYHISFLFGFLA